jgi:hypothetical protein
MKNDIPKYVLSAVLGLAIGAASVAAMKPQNQMPTPTSSTEVPIAALTAKGMEAHGMIRSTFQQHAAVAGDYLVKLVKGENTTAIRDGLDKNTQALTDLFAQAYGKDKTANFKQMWESHIKEYENYATAAKNKNEAGKTTARNSLTQMSKDLEQVMDQLNTTATDRVDELMLEHVTGTLALIDAAVAEDEAKVVAFMDAGFKQAGLLGDYYFDIVSREFPQMFQ